MNAVGWYHARLGDYDTARRFCIDALEHCTAAGYRSGTAAALDSLGYLEQKAGRHAVAEDYHERSLGLFREIGDRWQEADVLIRLGDNRQANGRTEEAAHVWRQARDILRDLGHPDAEKAAARLGGGALSRSTDGAEPVHR